MLNRSSRVAGGIDETGWSVVNGKDGSLRGARLQNFPANYTHPPARCRCDRANRGTE